MVGQSNEQLQRPQYGNAANREAAMKAFLAAWDRRPKAGGKG